MKIYSTLSLFLLIASLLGCNNLTTKKPHSLPTDRGDVANKPTVTNVTVDEQLFTKLALPTAKQRLIKDKNPQSAIPPSSQSPKPIKPSATTKSREKKTSVKLTKNNLKTTKQIIDDLIIPKLKIKKIVPSIRIVDLWQRIRQGYGMPTINNSRIQREFDKFINSPSYFKRITNKAQPYLHHIVEELEKREMPLELALLPAIESAYEPLALSHKSAAGLWQFMPATGRDYGLKQNYWYDGRRDIIQSTSAALDYLQYLHQLFEGDWFLALAAYNYGEGNVTKAIEKNRQLDEATDFWSLKLPRETREYVPKLLGLSKVVANPQKYGIQLQSIANKPYLKRLNVGRRFDLSSAAELAGLSVRELKRLNPAYRRGITAPKGPYYLTIPIDNVRKFKLALAKAKSLLARTNFSKPTKTQRHKVRRGENLTMIAKRYGTTVAKLRQLNKLKNGRPLYVGKRLKVPAGATAKTTNRVLAAKTQRHKVRRGENLTIIAKRYGTTVSLLRHWNKINGSIVKLGQFLKVPTTVAALQKSVKKKMKKLVHRVKAGETLWGIASAYRVSIEKIKRWNGLRKNSLLKGQRLAILVDS